MTDSLELGEDQGLPVLRPTEERVSVALCQVRAQRPAESRDPRYRPTTTRPASKPEAPALDTGFRSSGKDGGPPLFALKPDARTTLLPRPGPRRVYPETFSLGLRNTPSPSRSGLDCWSEAHLGASDRSV